MVFSKQVRRLLLLAVPALCLDALPETASDAALEERVDVLCLQARPVNINELRATLQILGAMPGRCYVNYEIAKLMKE